MDILVKDPDAAEELLRKRKESGGDKWDEVWDGVYVMATLPNTEHQELVLDLAAVLRDWARATGSGRAFPGVNVSDRDEGWMENYRCPDVVFFASDSQARNCDTHWVGGPDFLMEIASPKDDLLLKLPFYERVEVREALFIERHPQWALKLFRLQRGRLKQVGCSELPGSAVLTSKVMPLTFRLSPGKSRPQIEIQWSAQERSWCV